MTTDFEKPIDVRAILAAVAVIGVVVLASQIVVVQREIAELQDAIHSPAAKNAITFQVDRGTISYSADGTTCDFHAIESGRYQALCRRRGTNAREQ